MRWPTRSFHVLGDDTLRIRNTRDGSARVATDNGHIRSFSTVSVRFSPHGQFVAAGSCDQIILWDIPTGQPMKMGGD